MSAKRAWRCFVAIPLHEPVASELQRTAQDLGRLAAKHALRITMTRPEGRHLTLAFLGNIEEAAVVEVDRALLQAVAGVHAFCVTVGGVMTLPPKRPPRAIAAAIGRCDALTSLFQRVRDSLEDSGFAGERRSFRPHITLVRVRDSKSWCKRNVELQAFAGRRFGKSLIDRIVLFRSHLSSEAARYQVVGTYPLTTP